MTQLAVITAYLAVLLLVGLRSARAFRGGSGDFFVASHSVGPVLLLLSVFGTTMTAFALVGSTGEAYARGIGVYGLMASWSGLVHSAIFFGVGIPLWRMGRRHGFVTQIGFFRDRFESPVLGWVLFPILVGLVIPYLLIGLLGAQSVVMGVTRGAFEPWGVFAGTGHAVPPWLSGAVICAVVLGYVLGGGLRAAAWANAVQTGIFMVTGIITFIVVARALGGAAAATEAVRAAHPERLVRGEAIGQLQFLTYGFVPLSVGMFPHIFQHWLTARSARTFRLTVILHPVCIAVVWIPCVVLGVWATAATMPDGSLVVPLAHAKNTELAILVQRLASPLLAGVLSAGILAAIMSSLDSQFLCLGTMFTEDVIARLRPVSDRDKVRMARFFIAAVVVLTYTLSLVEPRRVFTLGVWCFSGFAGLFPLVVAAVHWRRATAAGALACVIAAAGTWLVLFQRSGYGLGEGLVGGAMPVAVIVAASSAALVLVSLGTRPPQPATVDRYFGNVE